MIHKHIVNFDYENTRLDRYLRKLYPLLTQGIIEKLLRKKLILRNTHSGSAKDRLREGDVISVPAHIIRYQQLTAPSTPSPQVQVLSEKIIARYRIFDHPSFMAIDKPASLATQGGSKIDLSVDHALKLISSEELEFKLVHRLDKSTSGILLIAKGHQAAVKLTTAFKERIIKKVYVAILVGIPQKLKGTIRSKSDDDKEAITEFSILARNESQNLCLCLFKPYTGVMHQLRYHATLLGCHILGDDKYQVLQSILTSANLMLHAYQITLPPSLFNDTLTITAPLPRYFLKYLNDCFQFDYNQLHDFL